MERGRRIGVRGRERKAIIHFDERRRKRRSWSGDRVDTDAPRFLSWDKSTYTHPIYFDVTAPVLTLTQFAPPIATQPRQSRLTCIPQGLGRLSSTPRREGEELKVCNTNLWSAKEGERKTEQTVHFNEKGRSWSVDIVDNSFAPRWGLRIR